MVVTRSVRAHDRNRYHIFRKWGRVGTTIGGSKLDRLSKGEATVEFCRLFHEKTGFPFEQREAMRADPTAFKRAGKFLPVAIDYGTEQDLALAENAGRTSTLPAPTQELMRMIFDVKLMEMVLLEFQVRGRGVAAERGVAPRSAVERGGARWSAVSAA